VHDVVLTTKQASLTVPGSVRVEALDSLFADSEEGESLPCTILDCLNKVQILLASSCTHSDCISVMRMSEVARSEM